MVTEIVRVVGVQIYSADHQHGFQVAHVTHPALALGVHTLRVRFSLHTYFILASIAFALYKSFPLLRTQLGS